MFINADVGEKSHDKAFLPYLDIANVACGFHAGSEKTMEQIVRLAKKYAVKISAHISYKDKKNFGRKSIFTSKKELKPQLLEQLEVLHKICEKNQYPMTFVKPHGALYNDIVKNPAVLECVAEAISEYDKQLQWIFFASGQNKKFSAIAKKYGLKLFFEAFADRQYENGLLMDRKKQNAVISNASDIVQRALLLIKEGVILNHKGEKEKILAQTLCFHGDNLASLEAICNLQNEKSANNN
jgi:UPF0271 protein